MDKVPNLIAQAELEQRIFSLRGHQVMIDRDLAALYDVETRALNQAVKRNLERFPTAFRFQLTEDEKSELITNCDRFEPLKHSSALPHAFTEQGVAIYDEALLSHKLSKQHQGLLRAWWLGLGRARIKQLHHGSSFKQIELKQS